MVGHTRSYWTIGYIVIESHQIILGHTHRVILGHTVMLGHIGSYWVTQDHIGPHRVILGDTGSYWATQGHIG